MALAIVLMPVNIEAQGWLKVFKTEASLVLAGPVTVTATAGNTGPVDYTTVKAAFDSINAGTHQGTITISIVADTTETASAVLNASGSGSASYTSISIVPSGARTVSGDLAAPLLDLNGADAVTINGLNSGGNSLTISNSSVSSVANTSTIRLINGAQNNSIQNCTIRGSSTTLVTVGGTVFLSTTTGIGNSNNTIASNQIGPAGGNLPIRAIYALGTTTNANTVNRDNLINANNIFDFFGSGGTNTTGIFLEFGNTNWTISNNRLYQTAPRVFTGGFIYFGIDISGTLGSNGDFHTITGNVIGFANAGGTGTTSISGGANTFRGINVRGSSATPTLIQGNTISGIDHTTAFGGNFSGAAAFIGIETLSSGLYNISGNTIGSMDGSTTIAVHPSAGALGWNVIGIHGSNNADTISGNNVGAISIQGINGNFGFRGIQFDSAGGGQVVTIANNLIGGPAAGGAIVDSVVGSYEVYGIQATNADQTTTGNIVRNILANQTANTMYGIQARGNFTVATTLSRNVVHSLSNTGAASVYGIQAQLGVFPNVVERNLVHSLFTSGDNRQIYGMHFNGNGIATVANNMVQVGVGSDPSRNNDVRGIYDQLTNNGVNYYFNSVFVGGTANVASSDSFAFVSDQAGNTRNFKDNIFWNARSNTVSGNNYAIHVGGTGVNPTGLSSDYNDLYATGTRGFVGHYSSVAYLTLANWQTATGQDAHSISADPLFINPTGNAATVDLHIFSASPCAGAGTAIAGITVDFDGDLRIYSNDIGADVPAGPTAAPVSISGRVMTAEGIGIGNASITLRDAEGNVRGARTSTFGYYNFDDIEVGQTYIVNIKSKGYSFVQPTRVVSLVDAISDLNFIALPQ
jgi:hypothetical protein